MWHDVRYYDSGRGSGEGPAVVLLHGLGNSLQYWVCVAPLLEAGGLRVVAVDIPGFGGSEPPATPGFAAYSQAIADLLAEIGVERFHVVGHSMGGVVAAALANRRSGAVSLLHVDSVPIAAVEMIRSPSSAWQAPSVALNLALQLVGGVVPLGRAGASVLAGSRWLRAAALWPFVHDTARLHPGCLTVALADNGGLGPFRAIGMARSTSLEEMLAPPDVPVRVLVGRHDRLVRPDDVEWTARHYQAVEVVRLEGAGHWPLLEAPEAVASYIIGYATG